MLELKEVQVDQVVNSPFQRNLSAGQVKKLKASIEALGFLIPIVVVPLTEELKAKLSLSEAQAEYVLVDGQHRLEAAKQLGYSQVPAVITEPKVLNFPTMLNIEKSDNLRDKCQKIYHFYQNCLRQFPDQSETALQSALGTDSPYIVPIAFAIHEYGLRSGSLIEPLASKVPELQALSELPFREAVSIRRQQAEALRLLEQELEAVASSYSITDFFKKQTILSIALKRCYGEARGSRTVVNIPDSLKEAVEKVISELKSSDWSFLE